MIAMLESRLTPFGALPSLLLVPPSPHSRSLLGLLLGFFIPDEKWEERKNSCRDEW